MNSPLRFADNYFDPQSLRGSARSTETGQILTAARVEAGAARTVISEDEAEATVRSLESAAKNGSLYDFATVLLGIRQTARYAPDGKDNARVLVDGIASAALNSPKAEMIKMCSSQRNCTVKPISKEEVGAVMSPAYPMTPEMNPSRAILVGTPMAAISSFVAATNSPQIVTGSKSPREIMEADQNQLASVVRDTRAAMRECLKQESTKFDLQQCAKIGARAGVYHIALNNFTFVEQNPVNLTPRADLPSNQQKKLAQSR